ncbi:ABC transporter ATP-binding protein [Oricola sp.]|uniref:ABC transporter ATP-binding protein n=1 Tax=Oricola sp. TaxID=1979950 RepID=UPI0025E3DE4D|nr:ABC transporter ATP-binding protein [Oricola sp.]MCI5073599.1 ABC transporter ATP-binding protein [Oricola sp.]
MSSDIAIRVRDVSKHYLMFDRPEDRLKQMVVPRFERLIGRAPRRYYRDFAALNGVSLDIARGETVGIIGRNGSGKSTLLQIVCGTLQPSSGSVEVDGRVAALLELGAGFNPEFTGRENVRLNAAILGLTRAEVEARFDDIARFADIGEFIDQPVKTYSSGMYVRLAFAVAVNADPEILVVDEALAVGDEAFRRKCFVRIEDIKDMGGTILFVSHAAEMVLQLCDRAVLFDRGEKILEGRPKAVVGQYQRLINASEHSARAIRAQIAAMSDNMPPSEDTHAKAVPVTLQASTSDELLDGPRDADDGADLFEPGMISKSMVAREERGARIRNPRIATLNGDQVNVLRMGRRYAFEFHVEFQTEASQIDFEMLFKNVSGIVVAGNSTERAATRMMEQVPMGSSVLVRTEFDCSLTPGFYLASCGVYGRIGSDKGWLHKLVECIAFRVAPEPGSTAIGLSNIQALTFCDIEQEDHRKR